MAKPEPFRTLFGIKRKLRIFAQLIAAKLSDVEAYIDYPPSGNARRTFLKLYLRLKQVQFSEPIWAGVGFRVFGVGNTKIGSGCSFGNYSTITNHGELIIGDHFLASSHMIINTGTHDLETLESRPCQIKIGDDVWVGVRVTFIEDTVIGSGCVVGAASLVKGKFDSNQIVVGTPARSIGTVKRDQEPMHFFVGKEPAERTVDMKDSSVDVS